MYLTLCMLSVMKRNLEHYTCGNDWIQVSDYNTTCTLAGGDKLRELDGLCSRAEPGTPGDFPGRAGGRGWAEEGQLGCLAQPIPMATRPE